jgi:transcriptional regulator with XRE-family HTH domain
MTASRKKRMLETFGRKLKTYRLHKYPNMSAAKFAESIGIEPPTYRTYERGQAEPGFEALARICHALDVTPNDLLPEAAQPRPEAKIA